MNTIYEDEIAVLIPCLNEEAVQVEADMAAVLLVIQVRQEVQPVQVIEVQVAAAVPVRLQVGQCLLVLVVLVVLVLLLLNFN